MIDVCTVSCEGCLVYIKTNRPSIRSISLRVALAQFINDSFSNL